MSRREHRRLSKAIDAWVDAELDAAAADRVALHIRDCWDCSSAAETALLVKRSLRRLRDREPRPLATARLRRYAEGMART